MTKRATGNLRIFFIVIPGLILLILGLVVSGGKATAQSNDLTGATSLPPTPTGIPTLDPNKLVTSTEIVNEYYTVKYLTLPDGTKLVENIIKGPPTPPGGYAVEQASVVDPIPVRATKLSTVPAFRWVFGCSAVSGAMVAGYYDRNGYPNIYTGPTDGGVIPLVEPALGDPDYWGTWSDIEPTTYPNNPLIASHQGLDGRTTRGSIDDYWVSYLSGVQDPYITNSWTQHTWGDAIGDYMKTSQSAYSNVDGSTSFYGYPNSATKLTCSAMAILGISQYDGTYGRKLFYEARGYTVTDCYAQVTDNKKAGGFSLANFKTEIDAGHPVFLNLTGHSVVGVGYDPSPSTTIYIHDTWDNSEHSMTWGETYSSPTMKLESVSIVNLAIPTAVELRSFTAMVDKKHATADGHSIILGWETASEVDNLGFNLYRALSMSGERIKVNTGLIPTLVYPGSPYGGSYSYTDAGLTNNTTYYYWLEDVNIHGEAGLTGPAVVKIVAGKIK